MSMTESELHGAVQTAVVGALGVGEDEASPDATLMDDLGAESIDLLDILFRIEKSTGVKIQASDLGDYMQGGISDDEFSDGNEMITEKGLEHLKTVMPQIDTAALAGSLNANDVIKLFTVSNLGDMVARRAGGAA
jgi:acyl carrier protein